MKEEQESERINKCASLGEQTQQKGENERMREGEEIRVCLLTTRCLCYIGTLAYSGDREKEQSLPLLSPL